MFLPLIEFADLPNKLKDDAIVEALVELRFETADIPELTVGRLADHSLWADFSRSRTPIADLPAALRQSDVNLKHQATLELKEPDGLRLVKIGTNAVSLHNISRYIGWTQGFSREIHSMVNLVLDQRKDATLTRIGLRYINALTPSKHLINSIYNLNIQVQVAQEEPLDDMNINYRRTFDDFLVLTRIATPRFVQGKLPSDTSAYVDIDVYTPPDFQCRSDQVASDWIEQAHILEKRSFFTLLPPDILQQLRVDNA